MKTSTPCWKCGPRASWCAARLRISSRQSDRGSRSARYGSSSNLPNHGLPTHTSSVHRFITGITRESALRRKPNLRFPQDAGNALHSNLCSRRETEYGQKERHEQEIENLITDNGAVDRRLCGSGGGPTGEIAEGYPAAVPGEPHN